ncbi:MAG TPA: GNAT family N-acetyltransferase [Solirubrobacterales bacterium]|nr:GNAT family N-acetyltransferase [Solirubrobacterales bacterium]
MTADAESERVALGPGIEVLVRPIRPSDKALLQKGFSTLTPESRYQRFFAPVERLTDSDLIYLTEVDHSEHEALIAIDPEDGSLVGVARYIKTKVRNSETKVKNEAEVAIIVSDAWQGKGLGTALLQRLARRAAEEGVEYFLALVLESNTSATELFENLIPEMTRTVRGAPGQVEIRIELPGPGAFKGSLLARALGSSASGSLKVSPWRRLRRRMARHRRRSAGQPD